MPDCPGLPPLRGREGAFSALTGTKGDVKSGSRPQTVKAEGEGSIERFRVIHMPLVIMHHSVVGQAL